MELPGERDNASNNVRCTKARRATHGLDGQHQDVDRTLRGRVNQNDRGQRYMEKVRPWCGQPSAKEQNRTVNAVLGLLSSVSFIWKYACLRSILEKIVGDLSATVSKISSNVGNGQKIKLVS